MAETYNGGITLTLPGAGERNWSATLRTFMRTISDHDHSGNGRGSPIAGISIADNGVGASQIRLANNEWLRGRNASNTSDVNIVKVNSSNVVELGAALQTSSDVEIGSSLQFSGSSNLVHTSTSDAADNSTVAILAHGGSGLDATRGAHLYLGGNESSTPGRATLAAGNVAGANLQIRTEGAHPVEIYTSGSRRWNFLPTGHISPEADDSLDIGLSNARIRTIYSAAIRGIEWEDFLPFLSFDSSWNATLSGSDFVGRFTQIGNLVFFRVKFGYQTSGIQGGYSIGMSLPVTAASYGGAGGATIQLLSTFFESGSWAVNLAGTGIDIRRSEAAARFEHNVASLSLISLSGVYEAA